MISSNENGIRWKTPLICLAFMIHANSVMAEETLTVIASDNTASKKSYVAHSSNTASRTNDSILATPQSVSVITRNELDDRNVQSITQALQYTPGVFASNAAIASRFDYFSIRGFNATLNGILQDGLRSVTQQSYVRYEPYGLEKIDVLRGPNGFLYGAGSPGGIINAVSKHPTLDTRHEVGFLGGSYGRKQWQFDTSGPVNDDKSLLYRVVGVARDSNTQFKHVPDNTLYLAPSFTWRPDTSTTLTVLASVNRNEFGTPKSQLPIQGTLKNNPNGQINRNSNLAGPGLNNHMEQMNLGYELDHTINDSWRVHSASRYTDARLFTQSRDGRGLAPDLRTLTLDAYQFEIKGKIFATDNNIETQWDVGSVHGSSVAGVSFRHTSEDYYLNTSPAGSIDIYHPKFENHFSATKPVSNTLQNASETGVYLSNSLSFFERLNLDLSARQDWAKVTTKNRLKDNHTSQDDHHFTGRAGISWVTDIGVAPYVSYTTSFAPKLGTDFYGQAYKPTTGKQWEAGVKYQPQEMNAMFTLAWFDLKQDNVDTQDPNQRLNTIQTGQITSKGIETSATANLTRDWNLVASYTWNDLETTKTTIPGAKGKTPTNMPEHMASLWTNYTIPSGPFASLSVGTGIRYVGSTWADTANDVKVPDYALVDAALHYDLGELSNHMKGLNIALNANNLFNKHYWVSCSSSARRSSCSNGFDRSLAATVSWHW